jgi:hypothetical protein
MKVFIVTLSLCGVALVAQPTFAWDCLSPPAGATYYLTMQHGEIRQFPPRTTFAGGEWKINGVCQPATVATLESGDSIVLPPNGTVWNYEDEDGQKIGLHMSTADDPIYFEAAPPSEVNGVNPDAPVAPNNVVP